MCDGDQARRVAFHAVNLEIDFDPSDFAGLDWSGDREPFALETSVPGVFAAGDVRLDSMKRVASAVGEGAMSVYLVHRYLATM